MPSFRGLRQTLRGGGNAGRGDSPYPHLNAPVPPPRTPGIPRPSERLVIGGGSVSPNPVPDTKSARKANSPKAKDRALKNVNKSPLTPAEGHRSMFSSDAGFEFSDPAFAYQTARHAEKRMAENSYPKSVAAGELREWDEDNVGSYLATGELPDGPKGSKWAAEHSNKAKREKYT